MSIFGERLAELREERGLTQIQLSKNLNMSNSSISSYETDGRLPPIDKLTTLARYFDVSTDYLLGLTSVDVSPSVLTEEFCKGMTIGELIQSLKTLPQDRRESLNIIIKDMSYSTDIKDRTKRAGG